MRVELDVPESAWAAIREGATDRDVVPVVRDLLAQIAAQLPVPVTVYLAPRLARHLAEQAQSGGSVDARGQWNRDALGRDVVDKDGSVALEWSEEVTASAGPNRRNGTLPVPDGFGLVMAPFDGASPVNVPARFRYRVGEGQATFGVVLEQAAKIQRDAFDAEVERIRGHAPFTVMAGTPDVGA